MVEGEGATLSPHPMSLDEGLDRIALQHLVSAYGHGIDRRDYGLLRTLYHDDATDDHSPYFCGPASDFIDWLPGMLGNWGATAHVMLSSLFLVDGDRAEGVVSARAWHLTVDGEREFIAWGRYADRYEKRDGVWRFAHRFFILDSTEERPANRLDSFATEGVETGKAGDADASCQRLPMFASDCARRG